MAYNPNSVVNYTFSFEDFVFTYALAAGTTAADVGKAVELDTSAAGKVKLATDDAAVFGRLETFEDRGNGLLVGAVSRKFRTKLPVKDGLAGNEVPGLGDTVVGAGAGEVKALEDGTSKTPDQNVNTVIEVGTDFVIVEKF
ncbi:hypothetical protein [Sphingopyxis flava]|uniref:Bacteriophage lambda head decoration protein D n=1 Tax=Sphingopyxis flava TaxID=1507287 RepID=A0A1T5CSU0_9SPHN|nr:hypothetical protein [Sphingopyxis flava]SKB62391.1 hypothetical protein SAMN06295937_101175 [Sphingopyxis flava]